MSKMAWPSVKLPQKGRLVSLGGMAPGTAWHRTWSREGLRSLGLWVRNCEDLRVGHTGYTDVLGGEGQWDPQGS